MFVVAVAALAACSSGQLHDPVPYPDASPGTVAFRLHLPATQSYCDQIPTCGGPIYHVTFANSAGGGFALGVPWCSTACTPRCSPTPCPGIACTVGSGVALTDFIEQSWDGSYVEWS